MTETLRDFVAELHVHTVLSPCADVEMIPPLIVQAALRKGIQILAITDHNATANVKSVQKAAKGTGLVVLPGMEMQTQEEVHMLCLFDTLEQLETWQGIINIHLPALENTPEYFGEQFVVDETGDFICREDRLLITSSRLSLDEAFVKVIDLGGLAIPAHVDREAFGLFANLGFVPPELPIDALEISNRITIEKAQNKYPILEKYALIKSGDVHYLNDFLGANHFHIFRPTIDELRKAFHREGGRFITIEEKKREVRDITLTV